MAENTIYDIIIIGAGPAGLTASIYASRYKLSNLVLGKMPGGTVTYAHKVENYPGLPGISGTELGLKMIEQAKALGAELLSENVGKIDKQEDFFKVTTENNKELRGKSLIIASGTERRKLNIPGEKEYLGKGISYCTNCDAPFFKRKTVILVGGANAACSGALHLAEFAQKVYLIYRKSELRAEPVWVEEVKENPKIEIIYNTNLTEVLGNGSRVTGANLDTAYNGSQTLLADGVFVEIGGIPTSSFLVPFGVELDESGYIKVNDEMETNVPGLLAAGDVTTKNLNLQQAITAAAQGAIAAYSIFKSLKHKTI